jgi:ATP-dependent Clp protease ATP-binding subunit ClpA
MEARELIGDLGYDPAYGARPLKRTIQREVVDPLAKLALAGELAEGVVAVVDAAGESIAVGVRERTGVPDQSVS